MRIKFEKGVSPDIVAQTFLKIIEDSDMLIGSVNIYIQEYDEEMKPVKFEKKDCLVVKPTKLGLRDYSEYAAEKRRERMKAV